MRLVDDSAQADGRGRLLVDDGFQNDVLGRRGPAPARSLQRGAQPDGQKRKGADKRGSDRVLKYSLVSHSHSAILSTYLDL